MNQGSLATKGGVTVAPIGSMENGNFHPRPSTASNVADDLQVRVSPLLRAGRGDAATFPQETIDGQT
jgi:predicted transcriptional regulator